MKVFCCGFVSDTLPDAEFVWICLTPFHTAPSLFHPGWHLLPLDTLGFYIPFLQLFKVRNTVFEQYLPCRSEAPPHSVCLPEDKTYSQTKAKQQCLPGNESLFSKAMLPSSITLSHPPSSVLVSHLSRLYELFHFYFRHWHCASGAFWHSLRLAVLHLPSDSSNSIFPSQSLSCRLLLCLLSKSA